MPLTNHLAHPLVICCVEMFFSKLIDVEVPMWIKPLLIYYTVCGL